MTNKAIPGLKRKSVSQLILLVSLMFVSLLLSAQSIDHGAVDKQAKGEDRVWNAETEKWTTIELFWQQFSASNKSKHWEKSTQYPEYAEVQEFDTFLVELPKGVCLMQFFHSRWRLANDVQRWAEEFNAYGGCPYVFD